VVLPKEFVIHEKRLSKEALESIKFQYDRLGLDSTDYKTFIGRFLRISKSPTLPPEDYEIDYLANKIAYMLSDYQFFDNQEFTTDDYEKAGAKIWYAMTISTQGMVDKAISILESINDKVLKQQDDLPYLESLAFRALFYHMHGSQEADKKEKALTKIRSFAEENHDKKHFDILFMPAYVITYRIQSLNRSPKENITELNTIYEKAQNISDPYWKIQILLELVTSYLQSNNIESAKKYLDLTFEIFDTVRFPILFARAVCIRGNLLEKEEKYSQAEKDYTSSKELFQKLGDLRGVSTAVLQLAELTLKQSQNEKAERYFNESFKIAKQMTDYSGMTAALAALAKIALLNNQFSDSLATYTKALNMATEHNFYQYLPTIYDGLAVNNFIAGDFWMSIKNRNHSVNLKKKFDYPEEDLLLEHMKLLLLTHPGFFPHLFYQYKVLCFPQVN
jgi:tetratricopeptide (TPR) repeat protein